MLIRSFSILRVRAWCDRAAIVLRPRGRYHKLVRGWVLFVKAADLFQSPREGERKVFYKEMIGLWKSHSIFLVLPSHIFLYSTSQPCTVTVFSISQKGILLKGKIREKKGI
jgi:hypothetical protein